MGARFFAAVTYPAFVAALLLRTAHVQRESVPQHRKCVFERKWREHCLNASVDPARSISPASRHCVDECPWLFVMVELCRCVSPVILRCRRGGTSLHRRRSCCRRWRGCLCIGPVARSARARFAAFRFGSAVCSRALGVRQRRLSWLVALDIGLPFFFSAFFCSGRSVR